MPASLQSLEGQVAEQESRINQLQAENTRLGVDLAASNEAKDSLQTEHSSVQGVQEQAIALSATTPPCLPVSFAFSGGTCNKCVSDLLMD
eukprot:1157512-Pelagomonas_calceolata.AAC.15